MRLLVFTIGLCIVIVSFLPYSISDISGYTSSLFLQNEETMGLRRKIISQDVIDFSATIEKNQTGETPILFITGEGNNGKTFFELSYLLFPRTIYWISPSPKGPISWWNEVPLRNHDIDQFVRRYSIQTIVTEGAMDETLKPIATFSFQRGNLYQYSTL